MEWNWKDRIVFSIQILWSSQNFLLPPPPTTTQTKKNTQILAAIRMKNQPYHERGARGAGWISCVRDWSRSVVAPTIINQSCAGLHCAGAINSDTYVITLRRRSVCVCGSTFIVLYCVLCCPCVTTALSVLPVQCITLSDLCLTLLLTSLRSSAEYQSLDTITRLHLGTLSDVSEANFHLISLLINVRNQFVRKNAWRCKSKSLADPLSPVAWGRVDL